MIKSERPLSLSAVEKLGCEERQAGGNILVIFRYDLLYAVLLGKIFIPKALHWSTQQYT